jgi:hypothetical protein
MNLVSIIFVASVASTLAAAERGLQTLTKRQNVNDPSFACEALGFDLDCKVSDFINDCMTADELCLPGCQENGSAVRHEAVTAGLKIHSCPLFSGFSCARFARPRSLQQ